MAKNLRGVIASIVKKDGKHVTEDELIALLCYGIREFLEDSFKIK
jgi:hypothetical protein